MSVRNPNFRRKFENFICENCLTENIGNGYTNHCFTCLCSKHVDVNPGDRQNSCGGVMKPVDYIIKGDDYIIIHQCQNCQILKCNKISHKDNIEELFDISKKKSKKLT